MGAQLSAEGKKGGTAKCGSKEGWRAQLSVKAKKRGTAKCGSKERGGGGGHS